MIVAVLRVPGATFDVDRFVQQYAITPDGSWRGGVSDSVGRVRSNSGMALSTAGASGTLDIGLTAGTSNQFTSSIVLAPQDLALLSGLGLSLSVSAYPASDP
jgi:hypothetical protein